MNGGMLGNVVKGLEWPLARKALHKCNPFTIEPPQEHADQQELKEDVSFNSPV
jgi:hypothetical protein